MPATVSLEKITPGWARTPEHGASYDLDSWEKRLEPLWWDDASYSRYQADDGPYGEWRYELCMDRSGAAISRYWHDFEFGEPLPSRAIRRIESRFGDQLLRLRNAGEEDRAVIHAAHPIPF